MYFKLSPLSGLLNPLLGYWIDRYGFGPMLMILLLSGSMHALLLWHGAFFLSVVLFSVLSTSCFSYMFSYLAFTFGFEYYGLLAGVVQFVASVATLTLQPRLRQIGSMYGWPCVQILEAVSFALLGLLLVSRRLLQWVLAWRRRRRLVIEPQCPGSPTLKA